MEAEPERTGPEALIRPEHLWLLWGLVALLAVSILVRGGGRRGWWSPRAELVSGSVVEYRIDLNRAGEAELALLPGIGEVRAGLIVAYRQEHGPFRQLEDLLAVKGIPGSLLDRLRPYVVTGPGPVEGEEQSVSEPSSSR